MTDALLLDFNGVVVDDEPLHGASFRAVLGEEGIALDEAGYVADYLGLNDRAAFAEALRRSGRPTPPARIRRLVSRKASAYAALAERGLPVVPGVRDFLAAAAATARVAVVSGAIRAEIESGLARSGLAGLVEYIVSADDVSASKPDPAGFQLALRELARRHGGGPWRAVIVEDSLPGLAAARALGAGCVMLTTSRDAAACGGADAVWSSFAGHQPAELDALWRKVEVA